MTRLKTSDICRIPCRLAEYNQELKETTGRSLLGIAAHAWQVDEAKIINRFKTLSVDVIPVTAGLGVITDFSETVAAILKYLGCEAQVAAEADISGLASAFARETDAVMMADDHRFVAINLRTRRVIDNSEATGRVFTAALDLMAGGILNREVLVLGCGPVGEAAAKKMLELGARPALYDKDHAKAFSLRERLTGSINGGNVQVAKELPAALAKILLVVEATPESNTITDELISDQMRVAAPGVPLGVSPSSCRLLKNRIVHDTLELGVAAMAVHLVLGESNGEYIDRAKLDPDPAQTI